MTIVRYSFVVLLPLTVAHSAAAQALPVDAFRLAAPNVVKPAPTTPADPASDRQLEDAFLSAQPRTDLSLSVTVNFRQLNRAEYLVPVSIRIAPRSDLVVGRGRVSRLDFLASITDANGITFSNMRDAVDLTLGPASIADLATTPIIYDASFTLLPGRYTLKVLARDQTTGRIGTSNVTFTIPNLERQQRALP